MTHRSLHACTLTHARYSPPLSPSLSRNYIEKTGAAALVEAFAVEDVAKILECVAPSCTHGEHA